MNQIELAELPRESEARNKPLLGCKLRNKLSKEWREVKSRWGIAGSTYNELTDAWTDNTVFKWD